MYKISRKNYEAAEQFLLSHSPKDFQKYTTITDVHEAVSSMLSTFRRHPQSTCVACDAILLLCSEDDVVDIYVDPAYSYQTITYYSPYSPDKEYEAFELV